MTKRSFIFGCIVSALVILLGFWCTSDYQSETFGPGTPLGYGAVAAGLVHFAMTVYLFRNRQEFYSND